MPAVDAPVSVSRVTLHLPPRYRSRLSPGEHGVVDDFTRGRGVAHGLDDEERIARADRIFAGAVEAWNENEFERAQQKLDELAELAAYGANAEGLQANVDLVRPRPTKSAGVYYFDDDDVDGDVDADMAGEGEVIEWHDAPEPMAAAPPAEAPQATGAVARRIRARLRARSGKKKVQYERRKRKAKELKEEGRYEEAAAEYRQAIEDSRELEVLEDEESVEYDFEADELSDELRSVEEAADSSVSEIVTDDAELDLVSGIWFVLRASDDEDDEDEDEAAQARAVAPPASVGPLVRVPAIGQTVRYQQLLLEAGEQRSMVIDAVRAWRDR